jgi:hypothetical protein
MGYEVLGPASTLVCLAMVTISIIRMVAGVMVRMIIIITKVKKGGIWILGAIWDMAFLVAISPVLWAMECGRRGAEAVSHHMEKRARGVRDPQIYRANPLN